MIRIDESQLPALGEFDEDTLKQVMKVMRIENNGVRAIDETRLGIAFQKSLREFVAKEQEKRNADFARQKREEEERIAAQAKAIRDAADARLKQWVAAAGLLEDEHNQQALIAFFQRNNMPYNAYNLDVAVKSLTAELHWAVWSPHLQPQPEEPQVEEVLGRIKATGEKQLPLNASEKDLRNASATQVKDWMARKRAADGTQYHAGIGSAQRHGISF